MVAAQAHHCTLGNGWVERKEAEIDEVRFPEESEED